MHNLFVGGEVIYGVAFLDGAGTVIDKRAISILAGDQPDETELERRVCETIRACHPARAKAADVMVPALGTVWDVAYIFRIKDGQWVPDDRYTRVDGNYYGRRILG